MDIELWKKRKKELKLTFDDLSALTNISIRTLKAVFSGERLNTTTYTVQAIEKALGLDKAQGTYISAEDIELLNLIKQLDDDQAKELSNFIDYLISKRK